MPPTSEENFSTVHSPVEGGVGGWVGALVGALAGTDVGNGVGAWVGMGVGDFVGEGLGLDVGAVVITGYLILVSQVTHKLAVASRRVTVGMGKDNALPCSPESL